MRVLVACRHGNERDGCSRCEARRNYIRKWRAENPDKVRAYSAKWNAANPEQRREIERSWRARNPDRVAAHNSKAGRKWASNNKGRRLASVRARQLAKRQRTPAWADHVMIRAYYETAAELTVATGIPHEVDHVIPLQGELISGLHVHDNLRILTRSENRSKQNRWHP
jgi:hypothetical protein